MSLIPMGGFKVAPNPSLMDTYPDVYLSTGLVAENHVRDYGISREEQDAFALRSHQRALAAIDAGRFAEEIVPVKARAVDADAGRDHRNRRSPWMKVRGAIRRPRRSRNCGRRFTSRAR